MNTWMRKIIDHIAQHAAILQALATKCSAEKK
jgi:hypothetical protein